MPKQVFTRQRLRKGFGSTLREMETSKYLTDEDLKFALAISIIAEREKNEVQKEPDIPKEIPKKEEEKEENEPKEEKLPQKRGWYQKFLVMQRSSHIDGFKRLLRIPERHFIRYEQAMEVERTHLP